MTMSLNGLHASSSLEFPHPNRFIVRRRQEQRSTRMEDQSSHPVIVPGLQNGILVSGQISSGQGICAGQKGEGRDGDVPPCLFHVLTSGNTKTWRAGNRTLLRTKFLIHCPLAASHSFIDLSLDPVAMNWPGVFARSAGWQ